MGSKWYQLSQDWIKEVWCNKGLYMGEPNRAIIWIEYIVDDNKMFSYKIYTFRQNPINGIDDS